MGLFLAMYGNNVKLSEALFISVFAMSIVFLVLLIISYLIDATAFFINAKAKNKVAKVENKENKVEEKAVAKGSDDTVVVIAAAIATYLGTSVDNVRIKSIRRVNQKDSPWTERGLFAQINKK